MEPEVAAEWVLKRACATCRKNESYDHPGCIIAREIYELLKSAKRVDHKLSNGDRIRGWLIPS